MRNVTKVASNNDLKFIAYIIVVREEARADFFSILERIRRSHYLWCNCQPHIFH